MRKVVVFTSTRADYGLLYWLMKDIEDTSTLQLEILASGTHLSPEFGLSYQQIENDGFLINEKVEMLLSTDTPVGVVKSMGVAALGFADALDRMRPDVLVILGDRFEALVAAQAAMIMNIPILHIHGGEITQGAYDDAIRHAITKMSNVHCVSAQEHYHRVVQLGEHPNTVFNVGALGLEHLNRTELLNTDELSKSLGFKLTKPFFLVTYHPVTLSKTDSLKHFDCLLEALDDYPKYQVIITFPNADNGARQLIKKIMSYATINSGRVFALASLGQLKYLSALKLAAAVVGNSSSGIIEAPSFNTPTVNVGCRQKGRSCAQSVIHTSTEKEDISNGISKAIKNVYGQKFYLNPYEKINTNQKIIDVLVHTTFNQTKVFFDLHNKEYLNE